MERIFYYQKLLYISKISCSELMKSYYSDILIAYSKILTCKLISRKYYWPRFYQKVGYYIKGCDIYLTSKTVSNKLYDHLQSLLILHISKKICL